MVLAPKIKIIMQNTSKTDRLIQPNKRQSSRGFFSNDFFVIN